MTTRKENLLLKKKEKQLNKYKKKNREKKKEKIQVIVFFIGILIFVLNGVIQNYILLKFGKICKGVITSELQYNRRAKATYVYKFIVNNESYEGNSWITESSWIGNEICIVYLPLLPYIHNSANKLNIDCVIDN